MWARRGHCSGPPARVIRNPLEPDGSPPAPVVVHTPTGRDGMLVAALLGANGYVVRQAVSPGDLLRQLEERIGALVLAEEALDLDTSLALCQCLAAQPSWSDLPLIALTSAAAGGRAPTVDLDRICQHIPGFNPRFSKGIQA